jgi:hypothetical protein
MLLPSGTADRIRPSVDAVNDRYVTTAVISGLYNSTARMPCAPAFAAALQPAVSDTNGCGWGAIRLTIAWGKWPSIFLMAQPTLAAH